MAQGTNTNGYERDDAPVRPIVWAGAVLAAGVLVTCLIVFGFFLYLTGLPPPPPHPMAEQVPAFPPLPRLEEHPGLELQALREREQKRLESYGWIDRDSGRIHIPVDRAIELQLERGFPTRQEAPQ
jgi:hypothetical protein